MTSVEKLSVSPGGKKMPDAERGPEVEIEYGVVGHENVLREWQMLPLQSQFAKARGRGRSRLTGFWRDRIYSKRPQMSALSKTMLQKSYTHHRSAVSQSSDLIHMGSKVYTNYNCTTAFNSGILFNSL